MGDPSDYRHPVDFEEFRRLGHAMVDAIADYRASLEQYPVRSQVEPGYLRPQLPASYPETAESLDDVLSDVQKLIIPGMTHWQHPKFFAWFPATSTAPALLGDMLSAAFGSVGFSWIASPAMTELESVCMDWYADLLNLPPCFRSGAYAKRKAQEPGAAAADSAVAPASTSGGGVIQGSASEACLVVLLAARARAAARLGVSPYSLTPRLIAYATEQAHSCVKKACLIAGVEHFALIPTRAEHGYRMQPEDLEAQVRRDVARGLVPFFCVALIGSTGLGAVDPVRGIAEVCQNAYARATQEADGVDGAVASEVAAASGAYGSVAASSSSSPSSACSHAIWLHVDAAYAGSFSAIPEARASFDGIELADSIDINAHKGGLVTFDCSALFFQDETFLRKALSLDDAHQYSGLRHEAERLDLKDLQIPLGRRFRALKLWLVLRLYGGEGYRAFLRHHVELGKRLAQRIDEDPDVDLFSQPCFGLVTAVARDVSPTQAAESLENLNASGRAFVTHTALKDGTVVVRFAIGGVHTQWRHVQETYDAWKEELDRIKRQGNDQAQTE